MIGDVMNEIPDYVVRQGSVVHLHAIPSTHDNMIDCEHIGAVQDLV